MINALTDKNNSFYGMIFFLIFLMSGLNGLAISVFAAESDRIIPIIRHRPPDLLFQGKPVIIRVTVESEQPKLTVILWHRRPGKRSFQKLLMKEISPNTYEGLLGLSEKNQAGIEYYLEAEDAFGNQGRDGSRTKPYFLEARTIPPSISFSKGTREKEIRGKTPFWKKTWFWIGVAVVVGGGVAVSAGSSGGQDTGTVIVE